MGVQRREEKYDEKHVTMKMGRRERVYESKEVENNIFFKKINYTH